MANGNQTNIVHIASWPKEPAAVNMSMDSAVTVRSEVPLCIRLCEPICARSEYNIGITIFDRPVATISISGMTRLFNCDEK
jgi:hypothetical protein